MIEDVDVFIYPDDMGGCPYERCYDRLSYNWKAFRGQYFDFRSAPQRDFLVVHNNHETEESLCWIVLHELGHRWIHIISEKLGYDLLAEMAGGKLSDLSSEEYQNYLTDDSIHDTRFEEIFCNQIATAAVGFRYDRPWWRRRQEEVKPAE